MGRDEHPADISTLYVGSFPLASRNYYFFFPPESNGIKQFYRIFDEAREIAYDVEVCKNSPVLCNVHEF